MTKRLSDHALLALELLAENSIWRDNRSRAAQFRSHYDIIS